MKATRVQAKIWMKRNTRVCNEIVSSGKSLQMVYYWRGLPFSRIYGVAVFAATFSKVDQQSVSIRPKKAGRKGITRLIFIFLLVPREDRRDTVPTEYYSSLPETTKAAVWIHFWCVTTGIPKC
jgi:hypothetical protein